MHKIKIYPVSDKHINFYLYCRNLENNKKYSSNSNSIDKLTHYNWWFSNNNRTSHIVEINQKKMFILTMDFLKKDKIKYIFTGLISCLKKVDIKYLLTSLIWQNKQVEKFSKAVNIILVHKKNIFGNKQQKYFKFNKLTKKDKIYTKLKNVIKIKNNCNIYFKIIK
jgi:hypothetical protein